MTDRYHSFVVVLSEDMRSDDAQKTMDAIAQIRGVLQVTPNISDPGSFMAEVRAKRKILSKMYEVFENIPATKD